MTRISLAETAHRLIAPHLPIGACAIDATVGNGHDTVFLAQCVGLSGQIYGFDIQPQALQTTALRLQQQGLANSVSLLEASHARMAELIPVERHGQVQAIMFNLGYLPGGDKSIMTLADSSLLALQAASSLLAPPGIMTVMVYPGHQGGDSEAQAVTAWCQALAGRRFVVEMIESQHPKPQSPRLFALRKQA